MIKVLKIKLFIILFVNCGNARYIKVAMAHCSINIYSYKFKNTTINSGQF